MSLQDLSGFSRSALQDFCRQHSLYAGGSHAELEARINEAVTEGRDVSVYFPALRDLRDGFICRQVEVHYDDNGKSCVHSLMEDTFVVKEEAAGDEETEEDSASEEEGDDADLPATMGWLPGTRLEVAWVLKQGRTKGSVWWPATLGRRVKGATDADGCQLYYIIYDALPEYRFNEAEKAKVGFIDGEVLNDDDRGEIKWRLMEASETEDSSYSEEEGSEYGADGYGVVDLTAGMAGLGSGVLGGSAPPRKRALIVACKNIMLLRDEEEDMLLRPTRRNILKGFDWLMSDLRSGDSLFLYFSGHGDTQDDPTGKERQGNQTICPCDYEWARVITDTEIHDILVRPLPPNTTLHALIDSCHSGTVMNLPYNAVLKSGHFSDWEEEYPGESWKRRTLSLPALQNTAGGRAVQSCAAQHDQYASEARMGRGKRRSGGDGQSRGAATYAFTHAIQRHRDYWGSDILYSDLLEAMSNELKKSNFRDQDPQMSCNVQLDLNRTDVKVTILPAVRPDARRRGSVIWNANQAHAVAAK
ncbi:hypothetical protein ABPG75_010874 [Micractinium tetrahymenae]